MVGDGAMHISPHSDLKSLVGKLSQDLIVAQKNEGHDLLGPILVISPSMQFSDWVQIEIARTAGLCMGFEFLMSGDFLERFFAAVNGSESVDANQWSKSALTWQILPHIQDYAGILGIQNPSSRDRLALAGLIGDQFEQYAHYRPDLIESWNAGLRSDMTSEDEAWQMNLWGQVREILGEPPTGVRLKELEDKVLFHDAGNGIITPCGDILADALKKQFPVLFVVGTGTLDPLLVRILKILKIIGSEVQIHVSLPSLGYLDDLRKSGPKIDKELDPESISMNDGHPLLVSMGRKAIGTFRLLGELDEQYTDWPEPNIEETEEIERSVLNRIQADIRNLRVSDAELKPADESLRVHSCFGARREMEVLRDELLRAFNDLKDLQPDEVLIVTPSLETYTPLISAVLEQVLDHDKNPISVRLTELPPSEVSPVAEGILALLEMVHHGGFEASALIELLHLRSVRTSLGIAEDAGALDKLRNWVVQSGLTRDLSENPAEPEPGTWQFASDRLVAGSWLGSEEMALYPGIDLGELKSVETASEAGIGCSSWTSEMMSPSGFILSIADELGGHRALRQRFLEWLGDLSTILNEWKNEATPRVWSERFTQATLELLISKSEADEGIHLAIQKQITFLESLQSEETVEAGAMLDWLEAEFEQAGKRTMVTGQITFGGFKHLQHIPCRVLAMVGMQDGAFPRQNRIPSWSLLRLKPKIWDRNARIEDRQLFLDAVLTPADRLIITASSRNIRSGKSEPLSVCVDELLRVAKTHPVIEHPLQPFSPGYFESNSMLPHSFDAGSQAVAVALIETVNQERNGISRAGISFWKLDAEAAGIGDCVEGAAATWEISLDDLIAFWKDPAKGYIRALGIQTYEENANDEELDWIPMHLDKLQQWKVKDVIVRNGIEGSGFADFTRANLLADRGLPPQKLGDDVWNDLQKTAEPIARAVLRIAGGLPSCSRGNLIPDVQEMQPPQATDASIPTIQVKIEVPFQDGKSKAVITGAIFTGIFEDEPVLLGYRVGKIDDAKDYLDPWIRALAAAEFGETRKTCLIDEKHTDTPHMLSVIDREQTQNDLAALVQGFMESRLRPLCYAPNTTDAYVEKATQVEPDQPPLSLREIVNTPAARSAMCGAEKKWRDEGFGNHPGGEGTTRTAKLAWRDQDPFSEAARKEWHQWACRIGEPLRRWFTLQNNSSEGIDSQEP